MKSRDPQADGPGDPIRSRAGTPLDDRDREILREIARESIEHGLSFGRPLPVTVGVFPTVLQAPGATFVTLETKGELRGCIGSLEPRRPLVEDVAENAFAAAFRDPRFPPLRSAEWPEVAFHISNLTPSEPLPADTREELLNALRPGVDGLVLEDPPYRSTFLPQVWESLPEPEDFLGELCRKAGLDRDHWSPTVRFRRYEVAEF